MNNKKRKFACAVCNKVFVRKSVLERHLRTIVVDTKFSEHNEFSCNMCEKSYVILDRLNRHARKKHGVVVRTLSKPKLKIKCSECDLTMEASDKKSLRYHMETEHQISGFKVSQCQSVKKKQEFSCQVCDTLFTENKSLLRHLRAKHTVETKVYEKACPCNFCEKSYGNSTNLANHIRTKHPEVVSVARAPKLQPNQIKCCEPECTTLARDRHALRLHMELKHNTSIELENLTFSSMPEFQAWKVDMERRTQSRYVKHSGSKLLQSDKKMHQFHCHRSGHFKPKGTGKRKSKRLGSNKMEGTCTSSIQVIETSNSIQVKFWKTHTTHSNCHSRPNLTAEERAEIAEQIEAGFDLNQIKNKSSVRGGQETSPLRFLTQQDLRNIRRDFKLQGSRIHKHNEEEHPVNDAADTQPSKEGIKKIEEKMNVIIGNVNSSYLSEEDLQFIEQKLDQLLAFTHNLKQD